MGVDLERKNKALIAQHLKTLKQDHQKREAQSNVEIAAAVKDASSYLHHAKGRGRKFFVV